MAPISRPITLYQPEATVKRRYRSAFPYGTVCPGSPSACGTAAGQRQPSSVVFVVAGDFDLTVDELRVVARYAVESAEQVLALFEKGHPGDTRPRAAISAAWTFAEGAPRTNLQRATALEAHRAAKTATSEAAKQAARAAGDAAAAAYLHPAAKSTQVGHILRAAACGARAAELSAGDAPEVGDASIEEAYRRAPSRLNRRSPPLSTCADRQKPRCATHDEPRHTPSILACASWVAGAGIRVVIGGLTSSPSR